MTISNAVWQGPGHGRSRGRGSGDGKQFTNADANSDEDMHIYESDEGDQFASNLFL